MLGRTKERTSPNKLAELSSRVRMATAVGMCH